MSTLVLFGSLVSAVLLIGSAIVRPRRRCSCPCGCPWRLEAGPSGVCWFCAQSRTCTADFYKRVNPNCLPDDKQ